MERSDQFRRVQLARTTLLLDHPFFGVLALNLQLVEDSSCPTAYTNGKVLGFNPAFVDTLEQSQLLAVVAHEVMHCAAGHCWRRGERQPYKWNVAADYAINDLLTEVGFRLPDSALLDPQFAGKHAEWIYDRLPDSPQGSGSGSGAGRPMPDPGGLGEVRDGDASDPDAPSEADWQQATDQAKTANRGSLPSSMRRAIDELMKPAVDWRSLLRRFMQDLVAADYAWMRPNRRYMASGLYLPSVNQQPAMGRIAIAVDTSGSIDSVLLSQFAAEINSIASELQPASIDVLYCDAKVHRIDTFDRGDAIRIDAVGGGGTSFAPVFAALQDDPPACCVYLTDLLGSFPKQAPDYPVLWAVYGGHASVAPFGDVVPCE